jgi:hypothetical protein
MTLNPLKVLLNDMENAWLIYNNTESKLYDLDLIVNR